VLEANRAYSREFGSSVRLRRGVRIDEALPLAEELGIVALMRSALESQKAVNVKCLKYDGLPTGTTYWNGSAVPVKLHVKDGLELGLAVVLVDVTDEIEARERMAEIAMLRARRARESESERARLDTIIQSVPLPLAVIGADGGMVTCNSAARQLAEVIGAVDWISCLVADSGTRDVKLIDHNGSEMKLEDSPLGRSLRGDVCIEEMIRVRLGARPARALNVNSAPLRDVQGNVTGAVLAVQDVTEQIRAQERINEIYHRDHAIAQKLQISFLPEGLPQINGFDIGERYHSALDEALVGGDFYDIFRVGEDQLGVVIADVAGKGLRAAVYTAMTKYMLRAYALEEARPDRVLAKLNEALTACTPTEVFVTLVYGVLNGNNGVFRYANAGHEHPAYYRCDAGMAFRLDVTGRALALARGSTYTTCEVKMRPGDVLALYTDGITDAGRGIHRMGSDRLLKGIDSCASRCAPDVADAVLDSALEFSKGNLPDDAALLVIKAI